MFPNLALQFLSPTLDDSDLKHAHFRFIVLLFNLSLLLFFLGGGGGGGVLGGFLVFGGGWGCWGFFFPSYKVSFGLQYTVRVMHSNLSKFKL